MMERKDFVIGVKFTIGERPCVYQYIHYDLVVHSIQAEDGDRCNIFLTREGQADGFEAYRFIGSLSLKAFVKFSSLTIVK